MTTVTTTDRTTAIASGSAAIPFTFQSLSAAEVGVLKNGVEQFSGFTVARNGDGTGTIIPTGSWGSSVVIIFSKPSFQQTANFLRNVSFYPDQLNAPMDRAARTMIALKGQVDALDAREAAADAALSAEDATLHAEDAALQTEIDVLDSNIEQRALDAVGGAMIGVGKVRVSYLHGSSIEIYLPEPPPPFIVDGVDTGDWPLPGFTPAQFVQVGDVDDGASIHRMGLALSAAGRGVLDFQGRDYTIGGGQVLSPGHQSSGYAFPPAFPYVLDITSCTGPVVIKLNGATFKCASGVKYGTFNDDGTNKGTVSPALTGGVASPYFAVIRILNCSGLIYVGNGELDGNIANAVIGGQYDVAGRQIEYSGLMISGNTQGPIIENIKSRHQGLDGITINGPGATNLRENGVVRKCDFVNNGRGNSFINGNGWLFQQCRFNGTGRDIGAMGYTGPGCGIDIEAEFGPLVIRNLIFNECEFVDNIAININAPIDTSAYCSRLTFNHCRFIGTTSPAYWIIAPHVILNDCLFVGTHWAYGSGATDPLSATKFNYCKFAYDTTLSPTGVVFVSTAPGSTIAAIMDYTFGAEGQEYNECEFIHAEATGLVSVGSPDVTLMRNCKFTVTNAASAPTLTPYGRFEGHNTYFHNCASYPDKKRATDRFGNYAGKAFDSYRQEETRAGAPGGLLALARFKASGDRATEAYLNYGTAAPASGTWAKGDRTLNTDVDSGEFMGWICTTAGTPGTHKGYGAVA